METENAYVKADIIAVSAEVSGRVVEVDVHATTSRWRPARCCSASIPTPFQIELARARAQMDVVRTDVQSLRAEYRETLLEATEARERIDFLDASARAPGAPQGERHEPRATPTTRRATTSKSRAARLESVEETHQPRARRTWRAIPSCPSSAIRATSRRRRPTMRAPSIWRAREVKAPAAGVVSNMKLQLGEFVEKGAPIFSLIQSGPVWIEANFKETQLTHMREGQPAQRDRRRLSGHRVASAVVAAIAPATGAEFAVLPPQNATGNWVKVVQRIPVRIRVEQPAGQPPLRAGMTVTVAVDTGRSRGLPRVVQRLVDKGWLPRFLRAGSRVRAHASG